VRKVTILVIVILNQLNILKIKLTDNFRKKKHIKTKKKQRGEKHCSNPQ